MLTRLPDLGSAWVGLIVDDADTFSCWVDSGTVFHCLDGTTQC